MLRGRLSRLLLPFRDQLLHAPVVHVSDVNQVLRWAGDAVSPIKLAEFMAGLAPHAENFSFRQLKLVEPTGFGVSREKILRRGAGDADGPRRGFIRTVHGQVAQNRMPRLVIRHIQEDKLLEISIQVEYLNAAVAPVGHIHVAVAINADVVRIPEMTRIFVPCRLKVKVVCSSLPPSVRPKA